MTERLTGAAVDSDHFPGANEEFFRNRLQTLLPSHLIPQLFHRIQSVRRSRLALLAVTAFALSFISSLQGQLDLHGDWVLDVTAMVVI